MYKPQCRLYKPHRRLYKPHRRLKNMPELFLLSHRIQTNLFGFQTNKFPPALLFFAP